MTVAKVTRSGPSLFDCEGAESARPSEQKLNLRAWGDARDSDLCALGTRRAEYGQQQCQLEQ
jgi:hypothetical protein